MAAKAEAELQTPDSGQAAMARYPFIGLRQARMRRMLDLCGVKPHHRILDVGGTPMLWQCVDWPGRIDLFNMDVPGSLPTNFRFFRGDGCSVPFRDNSYDFVFSSSTIEHVGGRERARAFALEVRRVGKAYWVQAPCRSFPIEPHVLVPLFDLYPRKAKEWVAANWLFSWLRHSGRDRIAAFLDNLWLPSVRDMHLLFPGSSIYEERLLGLVKSISAYRPLKT